MILRYHSVFVLRLIHNAEVSCNLSQSDSSCMENAQLQCSRRILEVPKPTPVAALFLELEIVGSSVKLRNDNCCFLNDY